MAEEMTFTMVELCQSVNISQDELLEVVGLGVIVPLDTDKSSWVFDYHAVSCLRRAQRLQAELDLDWSGIAMTLTLLDKIDELKRENDQLHRQLNRFLMTS
ncbi:MULTISPECIES: chaperone modulator CbpM [unclassified Brenneria]|uniref:chaperone modulator CbpM n=1 Tax=unclassified Brenneria TaxID=2634434 RepID=UPI001552582F|nr:MULTISPECIES: chaperone modulator CbpM [unclassified Brenneria]MBJ7222663.1 chaperone-modulator protein CbpM [Brenneria sp. L3-3C-1]MEE3643906.1 chaperone modulator CbpM [Brenneria sp. L3_3C_1]MEE3651141.1 chaperone modulator CbpM [Brenneria sp. HEZEL_4_2_4]NPD01096.1 chaperone-modulator protein CbpM [Brenneria sp. hezel4-2-4]